MDQPPFPLNSFKAVAPWWWREMRETGKEGALSLDDEVSKCDITCTLWQGSWYLNYLKLNILLYSSGTLLAHLDQRQGRWCLLSVLDLPPN